MGLLSIYCLQSGLKNKCQLDYALVYHIHIAVQKSNEISQVPFCVLLTLLRNQEQETVMNLSVISFT